MQTTTLRSVIHSTFSIERSYPATPTRVFAAFSNESSKRRWFVEGEGWDINEYTLDFREGGHEISRFRFHGGTPTSNDTLYLEIIPEQRIVFTYTMVVGDKRISASLATVELTPTSDGTHLRYTEQGAFFDGADQPDMREIGCRELFEQLGKELNEYPT